ncbi:serine protease [Streptomyces sp. NBC_01142]|uniref:serpin family protein n=1 Tax=Streptomyces sp. NBC_01142 TaxID=2975865 RepID=UPI0022554A60|nr:serpin family protein [Streptomyces sp. NBC_01142]MCX4822780.1 serine protease [Streptomyces sp. NBC_01142]
MQGTQGTHGTALRSQAGAVQRLGERWLRELGTTGGGDFVCSPAGLWLVLAAVAAGARGETARELEALLGVAEKDAAEAVTEAARELAGTDALGVATQVWSRVPVYREYREALPGIGFTSSMDPDEIDAWVNEATGGLIEKLPAKIADDTLLALVNVLALKARWAAPFSTGQTADLPFRDAGGAEHTVPTMRRVLRPGEAWTVGGTHVVELRCRATSAGEPARVRFVLGEEGAGAADVLPAAWASPELRRWVEADSVRLALPRFSLRTFTEITPQLPALGVRTATTEAADFSGMSPEPLAVSLVAQEAVVTVAERGVEAAAVSVVLMNPGSGPPPEPKTIVHIAFDRPFGVVVLDGSGEVPLFAGWQSGAPQAP